MKKTTWFPADAKPVRAGWYEVRRPGGPIGEKRLRWGGKRWLRRICGLDVPATMVTTFGDEWRGLCAPQKPVSEDA